MDPVLEALHVTPPERSSSELQPVPGLNIPPGQTEAEFNVSSFITFIDEVIDPVKVFISCDTN